MMQLMMSCDDLSTGFRAEFSHAIEAQLLARQFMDIRLTTETMAGITAKFWERTYLVPHHTSDERVKKVRYHDTLRNDIMEFVTVSGCESVNDMISTAREQKTDLEHIRKRRPNQVLILEGTGERPRILDQLLRGQQGRIQYNTCRKLHDGFFCSTGLSNYIYGIILYLFLNYILKRCHIPIAYRELLVDRKRSFR